MGVQVNAFFLRRFFGGFQQNLPIGIGLIIAGEEEGRTVLFDINDNPVVLLHLIQKRVCEAGINLELGH